MMFSDNFDYQTLKKDFVVGTLSEEELGKKIYLYVLQVLLQVMYTSWCAFEVFPVSDFRTATLWSPQYGVA